MWAVALIRFNDDVLIDRSSSQAVKPNASLHLFSIPY